MNSSDNPYEILGISLEASPSEIKSAYRKAALRHHPDKQRTEEARQAATVTFAKISNAYELLSDPEQRREYDYNLQYAGVGAERGRAQQQQPFPTGFDDFFASSFHQHHPFHDPFQVFESVFREEFGNPSRNGGGFGFPAGGSIFHDPFFQQPGFGGFGDPFGSIMHQQQHQQQHRSHHRDPFQEMFASMHQQPQQGNNNNGNSFSFTSTSTTTSYNGNGESVTTTTRNVNGHQVTERVTRKADGTVEREEFSSSNNNTTNGNQQQRIQDGGGQQQLQWQQQQQQQSSDRHGRRR